MKLDFTKEFNNLIKECENDLLRVEKTEIKFKTEKTEDEYNGNIIVLKKLLENGGNIYALWVKKQKSKDWELMYIGQRKSKYILSRLKEHFFKKDKRTGSQLEKIQDEIRKGNKIGVTVIKVSPDIMRTAVEEYLICKLKQERCCDWNIQR
jgi:hypothetical protein